MFKSKYNELKDFIILFLILGYIVIISVIVVNMVYKPSAETPSNFTETVQPSFEESEKEKKQPYHSVTESETIQEETRMVYIAPYGERYHYKSTCAGKNAITATFESVSRVYEPCKKCTD